MENRFSHGTARGTYDTCIRRCTAHPTAICPNSAFENTYAHPSRTMNEADANAIAAWWPGGTRADCAQRRQRSTISLRFPRDPGRTPTSGFACFTLRAPSGPRLRPHPPSSLCMDTGNGQPSDPPPSTPSAAQSPVASPGQRGPPATTTEILAAFNHLQGLLVRANIVVAPHGSPSAPSSPAPVLASSSAAAASPAASAAPPPALVFAPTTQPQSAPASINEIPAAWAQVLDSVTSTTLNSEAARTFWSRHSLSSFGPHRSTPPSTLGQDTDSVRVPQNNQYRQLVEQGLNYALLIQCVSDRALVALLRALDSPEPDLVAIRAAASAVASATATVGAYAEWYELTHVVYPARPVHSILSLDDVDYARRRLRQRLLQPVLRQHRRGRAAREAQARRQAR
jgi:hypothetical protein